MGNARDIHVDTVAFLVYLRLRAVRLYSLLELILGIGHVLWTGICFLCLIGDADTAGQIQAQLNAAHLGRYSVLIGHQLAAHKRIIPKIAENPENEHQCQEAQKPLSFAALHDTLSP